MSEPVPLPEPVEVKDLLEMLLGRTVTVQQLASAERCQGPVIAAEYLSPSNHVLVTATADVSLAAAAGAALALMPPATVNGLKTLEPGTVWDNWCEVANVMSRLVHHSHSPHLRLGSVAPATTTPPAVIRRRVFDVAVDGYTKGRLVFSVHSDHDLVDGESLAA